MPKIEHGALFAAIDALPMQALDCSELYEAKISTSTAQAFWASTDSICCNLMRCVGRIRGIRELELHKLPPGVVDGLTGLLTHLGHI